MRLQVLRQTEVGLGKNQSPWIRESKEMAQVPQGTSIHPVFTGSPDNIVGNFNNKL